MALEIIERQYRSPMLLAASAIVVLLAGGCGGGGGGTTAAAQFERVPAPAPTPVADPALSPAPAPTPDPINLAAICGPYIFTGFVGNFEAIYADAVGGVVQNPACAGPLPDYHWIDFGGGGGAGGGGVGGGGGGDGGAGGGAGEGKALGALMVVSRLSDGKVLGAALTDTVHGAVTIRPRASDGPVLLTLLGQPGATYYDEATDKMTDFGPGKVLHALVDRFDENVGVTPLTEAAYRYALNNFKTSPQAVSGGSTPLLQTGDLTGLTAEQVHAANAAVMDAVNGVLDPAVRLPSIKSLPTPIDNKSPTNALQISRYGIAQTVIGGLVKAAGTKAPTSNAPALGITEQIARDLTDGKLDGIALDRNNASKDAATSYYDPKTLPIAWRNGMAAVAQRFGQGTMSTITPPAVTAATFAGTFGACYAAEVAQQVPDLNEFGTMRLTVQTDGTLAGRTQSLSGASSAIAGRVQDDGSVAFGPESNPTRFSGHFTDANRAFGSYMLSSGAPGLWAAERNNSDTCYTGEQPRAEPR